MNLSEFSIAELRTFLEEIPREIKRREKAEKARIRKELEALAAKAGYSLDELLAEASGNEMRPRKSVPAKYAHPQNKELQWSGRGRYPKWVVEFIDAGGTLDQLVI